MIAMKKTFRNIVLLLCLVPFLTHCATKEEMETANLRMQSVDERVKELKEETVKNVQERQARVSDRLDTLEAEILRLNGQLEENAHHNRMLREENKELIAALNKRITREAADLAKETKILEERLVKAETQAGQTEKRIAQDESRLSLTENWINMAEGRITRNTDRVTGMEKDITGIKKARAAEATERANEAVKAAEEAKKNLVTDTGPMEIVPDQYKRDVNKEPAKAEEKDPSQAMYDHGLALFREKKYQDAYQIFAQFVEKYPKNIMKANAMFWKGDCRYGQQKYDQAILEYQKVIVDFPQNSKAPAALLKLGLSFEKIKDHETAKIIYNQIIKEYPNSDQVKTAQSRLTALK